MEARGSQIPKVIDCDSHVVEPRDVWRKFIDPAHRELALSIVDRPAELHGIEGRRSALAIGDRKLFDVAGFMPAGEEALLQAAAQLQKDPAGYEDWARLAELREHLIPYEDASPTAAWDPTARLKWIGAAGIDATLLFPTWGLMWERYLVGNAEATCVNMRSYNRWIEAFCATSPAHLLPVGQISLLDVGWAEEEIVRLARAGFRACMIRPVLVNGLSPAHPRFERVYSALEDCGLALVFHIGGFGAGEADFLPEGWYDGDARGPASGVTLAVAPHIPALLTLTSMLRAGIFAMYPRLRVGVLELGSAWMEPWLRQCDVVFSMGKLRSSELASSCPEPPSHYIRRQVWMAPLEHEWDSISTAGPADRLLFTSDYPHPESSDDPMKCFEHRCPGLGDRLRTQILSENAAAFLQM